MLTILGTLSKCFGLLYMGHKCLRSELFRIDEMLAFCDIPAKKLTLGWDLDEQSKQGCIITGMIKSDHSDNWILIIPTIEHSILIHLIQSFQLMNIQSQSASSDCSTTEYSITIGLIQSFPLLNIKSDLPNPIIPTTEYCISIHLNLMSPSTEYWIPIHLIQLFHPLNIWFRSA